MVTGPALAAVAPDVLIVPVVTPFPIKETMPPDPSVPVDVMLLSAIEPVAYARTSPPLVEPLTLISTVCEALFSVIEPGPDVPCNTNEVTLSGPMVPTVVGVKLNPAIMVTVPPGPFGLCRSIVVAAPVLTILPAEMIARLCPWKVKPAIEARSSGPVLLAIVPQNGHTWVGVLVCVLMVPLIVSRQVL